MEVLIEFLIEALGELILCGMGEILSSAFCRWCLPPSGTLSSIILRSGISGAILGMASVFLFTECLLPHDIRFVIAFILVPLALGIVTMALAFGHHEDRAINSYYSFYFGVIFALAFNSTRAIYVL